MTKKKLYAYRLDDGSIGIYDGINTKGAIGFCDEESLRACLNPDANDDDNDNDDKDELKAAVRKRMTDKNLSYAEALREVTQTRPELWEQHKASL